MGKQRHKLKRESGKYSLKRVHDYDSLQKSRVDRQLNLEEQSRSAVKY